MLGHFGLLSNSPPFRRISSKAVLEYSLDIFQDTSQRVSVSHSVSQGRNPERRCSKQ